LSLFEGIKICSNEGNALFQGEINNEKVGKKIKYEKILFSRTSKPI
jgi:hypothetical protein